MKKKIIYLLLAGVLPFVLGVLVTSTHSPLHYKPAKEPTSSEVYEPSCHEGVLAVQKDENGSIDYFVIECNEEH